MRSLGKISHESFDHVFDAIQILHTIVQNNHDKAKMIVRNSAENHLNPFDAKKLENYIRNVNTAYDNFLSRLSEATFDEFGELHAAVMESDNPLFISILEDVDYTKSSGQKLIVEGLKKNFALPDYTINLLDTIDDEVLKQIVFPMTEYVLRLKQNLANEYSQILDQVVTVDHVPKLKR